MELKELQQHVRTLATLNETAAPVISCYLNLENGTASYREPFEARMRLLRKSLAGTEWRDFEEAAGRIRDYLARELRPESKGVVIFARGGAEAFFLPLQFRVPLPNWVVVGSTPNIFHLVELKDTYDRYVVMISTEIGNERRKRNTSTKRSRSLSGACAAAQPWRVSARRWLR